MKEILSIMAGLLYIVGFIPYIQAVRHKKIKPAKASWIIWASLDTITIAGMAVEGSINGQIIGAFAGAWVVCILAIKYGQAGWTILDKACFIGAAIGIILWLAFDSPIMGIITSLGVVFLGSIPTFVSAWEDPSRENKAGWTLFWISCVLAIIAIPQWTLADAAQPITFAAIETVMMYLLYIRPLQTAERQKPK